MKPRIATNLEDLGVDKSNLKHLGFTHFYSPIFSDTLIIESIKGKKGEKNLRKKEIAYEGFVNLVQSYLEKEDLYLENPTLKRPKLFALIPDSMAGDLYKRNK